MLIIIPRITIIKTVKHSIDPKLKRLILSCLLFYLIPCFNAMYEIAIWKYLCRRKQMIAPFIIPGYLFILPPCEEVTESGP